MASARGQAIRARNVDREEQVTPLELFFDLVFVFALTQVTGSITNEPTWAGAGRGLLVLAALWWAWAAYAWLTNVLDPEEGPVRLVFFAAMAAMLVVALAVPGAFGEHALMFGVTYLIVRQLHIALYLLAAHHDEAVRGAVLRLAVSSAIGPGLIVVAAFTDGTVQAVLWLLALAIDYSGPLVGGMEGWRVSPDHFAERFGLIIIIALGESIVAIGIGATETLDAGVVTAAVLGIAAVAALWWAYFDVVAPVAERRLTEAEERERVLLARDSYSYLHLPMIAGIILFAVGLKKTLGDVGDELATVPAATLCGGVALYLLGHIAFRLRNLGTLSRHRLIAAMVLLALIPAVRAVPALVALALVTAALCLLIAYEAIRFSETRHRVRHAE
jgi:low temperature requirement protein LtrA